MFPTHAGCWEVTVGLGIILGYMGARRGPIPLNSRPSFLSGVSADAYAASLPVGSITVYASSGVCLSRLECGLD